MSVFERHPRITLFVIMLIGMLGIAFSAEYLARSFGLGKVVIYQSHPIYGYRPGANQDVSRTINKTVSLNNVGLRAAPEWPETTDKTRIIFLGDSITYGGSYIDDSELFSSLSTQALPNVISGNAGVNGWGVLNVKALVDDYQFMPGDIFISTFPEEDFERGLNRFGGTPFWPYPPQFALSELFQYFVYKLSLAKHANALYPLSDLDKHAIIAQAVDGLAAYDHALKAAGKKHLIYITPTRKQAEGLDSINPDLKQLLEKASLNITYLNDRLPFEMPIADYYHDAAHLSEKGHALWATVYEQDLSAMLNDA